MTASSSPPRIVLVGAVLSTQIALRELLDHGVTPVLLITVPVQKAAMHSDYVDLTPEATAAGVQVIHQLDVNQDNVLSVVADLTPDFIWVIGWSRLCGARFCALATKGVLGYHPTLLPKMRGRAALAWTLLLAPERTGGTLFWIDDGVDSGDIAVQQSFVLASRETLPGLMKKQMTILAAMLRELIPKLLSGAKPAHAQDHSQATYVALRRPDDGCIRWRETAESIDRLVRSVTRPYPGAYTYSDGNKITIWQSEPVEYPQWHAQVGQIFLYEGDAPVVRCGEGSSLKLLEYEFADSKDDQSMSLKGQIRLGVK